LLLQAIPRLRLLLLSACKGIGHHGVLGSKIK
jgi:hypothetical protein